jgi:hypothetical protein
MRMSVDKWTQSLHKELYMRMLGIWIDKQVTKDTVETTWQEFGMPLAEVNASVGCGCCRNTATRVDRIKPLRFNKSPSWDAFCYQFKATVGHNWAPPEKTMHLLAIPQGQAGDILYSIPAEVTYEEITMATEGHYRDHQLAAACCSQLITDSLPELATIITSLAHHIPIGAPVLHPDRQSSCIY